ncbi:uncharacterized protein LOC107042094 [Diachasma alloeum]|uniref:uncharacterized protein LOC107042094 n=1 Tax=Diachasma alloeum TaxID=454923 RepID=UPI0007383AD6|nr:uncharacterized protein LOC107042094 [Diachasma alloeum]
MSSSEDSSDSPPPKKSHVSTTHNLEGATVGECASVRDQVPKGKKETGSKFRAYYDFEVRDSKPVGICLECKKRRIVKMIGRKDGSTSGMKKHLETAHKQAFNTLFPASTPGNVNPDQRLITEMHSTSQKFFTKLNPDVKMPKRDTAKRMVIRQHAKREEKIKTLLHHNSSKVSFTIDVWTSFNGRSYYGITIHYVGNDWKIHSLVLDFVPARGSHTGKAIAKIFFDTLNEFDLQGKVQGITVDNASANTTFMLELGVLMNDAGYSFDNINQHFRCGAHILALGVQNTLSLIRVQATKDDGDSPVEQNSIDNSDSDNPSDSSNESSDEESEDEVFSELSPGTAVIKLRNTFKKIKKTEKIQNMLRSFCNAAGIKYLKPPLDKIQNMLRSFCNAAGVKYLKPPLDVSTRWGSTDYMINAALRMKKGLNLLWSECEEVASLKMSEDEWILLTRIHDFLKDFDHLSKTLGAEKYVTLPLVVVAFNMLLDRIKSTTSSLDLKEERTKVDEILIEAFQAARDKIIKHYNKTNWVYCAALILDPRHKVSTFEQTQWGREMKEESLAFFERMYKENYTKPEKQTVEEENTEKETKKNSSKENDDHLKPGGIDLNSIFTDSCKTKHWRDELEEYLNLSRADKHQDLLEWWRARESTFPTLAKMARDLFSIPATSVPAERLFSLAGLIITNLRNSMSDKSARALLCLHSWASCEFKEFINAP